MGFGVMGYDMGIDRVRKDDRDVKMILGMDIDMLRYVESRGYGKGKMWKEGLGYGYGWGKMGQGRGIVWARNGMVGGYVVDD